MQDGGGTVNEGALVVPGRDGAPLLELAAADDVAVFVVGGLEVLAATARATPQVVAFLIFGADGDRAADLEHLSSPPGQGSLP